MVFSSQWCCEDTVHSVHHRAISVHVDIYWHHSWWPSQLRTTCVCWTCVCMSWKQQCPTLHTLVGHDCLKGLATSSIWAPGITIAGNCHSFCPGSSPAAALPRNRSAVSYLKKYLFPLGTKQQCNVAHKNICPYYCITCKTLRMHESMVLVADVIIKLYSK